MSKAISVEQPDCEVVVDFLGGGEDNRACVVTLTVENGELRVLVKGCDDRGTILCDEVYALPDEDTSEEEYEAENAADDDASRRIEFHETLDLNAVTRDQADNAILITPVGHGEFAFFVGDAVAYGHISPLATDDDLLDFEILHAPTQDWFDTVVSAMNAAICE